jgi:lipoprotein NlpI
MSPKVLFSPPFVSRWKHELSRCPEYEHCIFTCCKNYLSLGLPIFLQRATTTSMRWLIRLFIAACVVPVLLGQTAREQATDVPALLRKARTATSTNVETAIRLCDQAVALAPSNAEPWLLRATLRERRRDFGKAIDDASEALKVRPDDAAAWQFRGTLNFKASRFKESVRDFDRFLELVPAQRPHHWQRGISLYYAGDFAEGARQFELHETVNGDDVENDVWHFLCVARAQGIEKARAGLLKPGSDPRAPMDAIYSLFAGKGTPENVLAGATAAASRTGPFYAHLYLGLYYEVQDNQVKAQQHIDRAVMLAGEDYMGDVARVHQTLLRTRKR